MIQTHACIPLCCAGPGPYLPKPHAIYLVIGGPIGSNIVTAGDDTYWRAVRQAAAPSFNMSNLKQVIGLHWGRMCICLWGLWGACLSVCGV